MKNVHWLGTGLSSIPGIRRLASKLENFTVWNRTLEKAEASLSHIDKANVKASNAKPNTEVPISIFLDFKISIILISLIVSVLISSELLIKPSFLPIFRNLFFLSLKISSED